MVLNVVNSRMTVKRNRQSLSSIVKDYTLKKLENRAYGLLCPNIGENGRIVRK